MLCTGVAEVRIGVNVDDASGYEGAGDAMDTMGEAAGCAIAVTEFETLGAPLREAPASAHASIEALSAPEHKRAGRCEGCDPLLLQSARTLRPTRHGPPAHAVSVPDVVEQHVRETLHVFQLDPGASLHRLPVAPPQLEAVGPFSARRRRQQHQHGPFLRGERGVVICRVGSQRDGILMAPFAESVL
eukprot:1381821-Rhodomonas_salina.1